MPARKKSKLLTVLLTCLLTGTLDGLAALLISHRIPPAVIFRFIASGWFGRESMSGGTSMVLWGLVFHYLIAAIFSTVLFLIYPFMIKIFWNKYFTGIFYGIAIWLIMNFVVLPFTNIPKSHGHLDLAGLTIGIAALVICVGGPVAFIADSFYKKAH